MGRCGRATTGAHPSMPSETAHIGDTLYPPILGHKRQLEPRSGLTFPSCSDSLMVRESGIQEAKWGIHQTLHSVNGE